MSTESLGDLLYSAASWGNFDLVKYYVTNFDPKIYINYENPQNGNTPLYIASSWGFKSTPYKTSDYYDICEFIIANGADVNIKNKDGKSPLWIAASWGNFPVVELLISNGADLNSVATKINVTPLQIAAYAKNLNFDNFNESGKHHAAHLALTYMKHLLLNREDLKYFGNDVLTDYKILKRYIQADPYGHKNLIKKVFKMVIFYNYFCVVEMLIRAGAEINTLDKNGSTALDQAKRLGHVPMANLLQKMEEDLSNAELNPQVILL